MPSRDQIAEPLARTAMSWGLLLLAGLAVLYPLIAELTMYPLTVFALPVLIVSLLGRPIDVGVIGALALSVALLEGEAVSHLGLLPMLPRVLVILATTFAGIVVARLRIRREEALRSADMTTTLMETFQQVLVPRPSPPPGIVVSSRFVPGEERLMLGGDFLDALDLPDGSLGFVIGDVCGHGPAAAALGAALRAGWKTVATSAPESPEVWVQVMDEAFFAHGRHDTFATVCAGRVGRGGHGTFVSCGHPWPVLVSRSPHVLVPQVGRPLGIRNLRLEVAETEFCLAGESALLLYTDGLIENRRKPATASEAHLLAWLGRERRVDLDHLLSEFGPTGFSDDVAVMSVRIG